MTSRTKDFAYGLYWKQNRKNCIAFLSLESKLSMEASMKWLECQIQNLEIYRKGIYFWTFFFLLFSSQIQSLEQHALFIVVWLFCVKICVISFFVSTYERTELFDKSLSWRTFFSLNQPFDALDSLSVLLVLNLIHPSNLSACIASHIFLLSELDF